jgi:GYF domain 2
MTDSYQRGNNLPERRSGTGEHLRPPNPNLPPHPLDAEWWLHIEGKTYGPFSGHKIREYVEDGRVGTATSTLRAGSENWQRAIDDPILGALFDPRRLARKPQTTNVSAKDGATVVQVTNTIAPHPVVFLDDGPAQPKSAGFALFADLWRGPDVQRAGRKGHPYADWMRRALDCPVGLGHLDLVYG